MPACHVKLNITPGHWIMHLILHLRPLARISTEPYFFAIFQCEIPMRSLSGEQCLKITPLSSSITTLPCHSHVHMLRWLPHIPSPYHRTPPHKTLHDLGEHALTDSLTHLPNHRFTMPLSMLITSDEAHVLYRQPSPKSASPHLHRANQTRLSNSSRMDTTSTSANITEFF